MDLLDWTTVGPFETANDQTGMAQPFLAGFADAPPEAVDWNCDLSEIPLQSNFGNAEVKKLHLTPFEMIDFYSAYDIEKSDPRNRTSTFFAQTSVRSDRECLSYLLVGSDGALVVWLNGKRISVAPVRREMEMGSFHVSMRIALSEGVNTLLFKAVRVTGSFGLQARIVPEKASLRKALLDSSLSVFRSITVNHARPLVLHLRGWPDQASPVGQIDIYDSNMAHVALWAPTQSEDCWTPSIELPDGLYRATALIDGVRHSEEFTIGDLETLGARLIAELDRRKSDEAMRLNIDTLKTRWRILQDERNRKPSSREWQRKCVYTLSALNELSKLLSAGQTTRGLPGLHLRAFTSEMDGNIRHYRLFVPPSYTEKEKLTLGVFVPTAFSSSRPFIESSFVAHHLDAEALATRAQKYGLGLVWMGYPCQPNGNPSELQHLREVLSAIGQDYAVDWSRIYLLGTCHAGAVATMYAQAEPTLFAGVGVLDPIGDRWQNAESDPIEFYGYKAYRDWIHDQAPLYNMDRLREVPLIVVHDGSSSGHGSREEATKLFEAAVEQRCIAEFVQVPLSRAHFRGWEELLRRLVQRQSRPRADNDRSGVMNSIGPIMRAFPEGFVLVKGTVGEGVDDARIEWMAERWQETWSKRYYGPCRILKDTEVTDEVERSLNLVLLGNARTNSIWARLESQLELRLERDLVEIYGRRYRVPSAGLQAVFRHPAFSDRRVVVVGAADLANTSFGNFDLSVNGWFDYAIWSASGLSSRLAVADRIDQ